MDSFSSQAGPSSAMVEPKIEELVLDAGPLLTQQKLRGLAKKYYITSNVVAELRDKRARDHFDWLRSEAGGALDIEICDPSPESKLAVIAFAKQTGDYSVLSLPDLSVLALTYALETKRHGTWRIRDTMGGMTGQQKHTRAQRPEKADSKKGSEVQKTASSADAAAQEEQESKEALEHASSDTVVQSQTDLDAALESDLAAVTIDDASVTQDSFLNANDEGEEDIDSEDDEETGGEWISPDNIDKHKSLALGLVTDSTISSFGVPTAKTKSNGRLRPAIEEGEDGWSTVTTKNTVEQPRGRGNIKNGCDSTTKKPQPKMTVACITGDYAVQNVLLQMGLSLVSLEGHRIRQVKAWVLRCHACFKICKDSERKFCPQCGNATLMRTSVTSTDPQQNGAGPSNGVQVHLRKNFQYKNRGTKYPLPLPKAGKAAGAAASVPILREDQPEWQRAVQREKIQRSKEERALNKALERGSDSISARYEDTDALSILLAGGKNSGRHQQGLPELGIGRRNPNERRRKKV
jgi:RNA-binding protein NOB1